MEIISVLKTPQWWDLYFRFVKKIWNNSNIWWLDLKLPKYYGRPFLIVFTIKLIMVSIIWAHGPISLENMSIGVIFYLTSLEMHHSNIDDKVSNFSSPNCFEDLRLQEMGFFSLNFKWMATSTFWIQMWIRKWVGANLAYISTKFFFKKNLPYCMYATKLGFKHIYI